MSHIRENFDEWYILRIKKKSSWSRESVNQILFPYMSKNWYQTMIEFTYRNCLYYVVARYTKYYTILKFSQSC